MGTGLAVVLHGDIFFAVAERCEGFGRPALDENVVVEAVVPVKDGHEAHHLGAVRQCGTVTRHVPSRGG